MNHHKVADTQRQGIGLIKAWWTVGTRVGWGERVEGEEKSL